MKYVILFFFKQKTAYEMRISDWSSDVFSSDLPDVLKRRVPVRRVKLAEGEVMVATVFDLFVANYGLDRGLGGGNVARSYDENEPYTPAWAEKITGVPANSIVTVAREFARNAEKTKGRSMVILGDRKSTRLTSSHSCASRMPSSA